MNNYSRQIKINAQTLGNINLHLDFIMSTTVRYIEVSDLSANLMLFLISISWGNFALQETLDILKVSCWIMIFIKVE